jgi:outer membrane lipoprotein-sorting protein
LKNAVFIFLTLLILTSIIPGCVPSKPTEDVEILPSERLISKLEANRRRIRSFEGSGTIQIKSNKFNNSASFNVVLMKPDSIYLTIMGPFGIELAQALVTKQNFVFYDALQNTAYEGESNSDVLKNIFKIDLTFNELVDAFIGSVNLTDQLYKQPANYNVDYDHYVITYVDSLASTSTQYKVDVRELGITNYILTDKEGDVSLEGKYSKFGLLENVAVPYHIEVMDKKENQLVTIDYKSMHANKKDIYIDFSVPSDATIIKW